MKKRHFWLLALIFGLTFSFTACDDSTDEPDPDPEPTEFVVNKTMAQIQALAAAGAAQEIDEEAVFEGIVISNDGTSDNFYRKLIIQNGNIGVQLSVLKADGNKETFYKTLASGQKVKVNAEGLFIGIGHDAVVLGAAADDQYTVTSIDDADLRERIQAVDGGEAVTAADLTVADITDAHLNTLVRITGVQFITTDLTKNFGQDTNPDGGFYNNANRTLTTVAGQTIIVRTSQYASFAETDIPEGSGSVTAVLGKFNDNYQLYIRAIEEVALTEARFEVVPPFTAVTLDTMDEGFNDATASTRVDATGWYTENVEGEVYWGTIERSGNKYAEIKGYNSNQDAIVTWMVTPGLNLDATDSRQNFSFESVRGYTKQETLEVMISSDFDPDQGVAAATWEPLTVTLPEANTGGFTSWTNSGDIDLSAKSGEVHIAFKYTGNQTDATGTWQVDNVKFNYEPTSAITIGEDTDGRIFTNVENFDNAALTSSYADGNFVGANSITWTYVHSRDHNNDANGSGIQGNAIMLRRVSSDSKITSSTISGGINKFTVKMYKGFTGGGDRQIEVVINGNVIGRSVTFDDVVKHECTFEDLGITGDFTIEIRNVTGKQVIIDDISWE